MVAPCSLLKGLTILTSSTDIGTSKVHNYLAVLSEAFLKRAFESQLKLLMTILPLLAVQEAYVLVPLGVWWLLYNIRDTEYTVK